MKRALDIFAVLMFSPLWLPVLLVTAAVVRLGMGSPVFFRQERAGLHGRAFDILKFRTMREGEGTDGERLTRLGRLLRATSLDEVPELLNILRGDMSIVGPRPLPTRYLPRYTPDEARRHDVRPGLTGWAVVHGRNLVSWEDKFRYDVEYVDNQSLWLDLKIIGMTVMQVLTARGISAAGEATMSEFRG